MNVYTGMIVILVTDSIQVDWMMQLCLRIVLCTDAEEILPVMLRDQSDQSKAANLKCASVAGYGSLHSLVAHKDKFTDESQRLLLKKVLT